MKWNLIRKKTLIVLTIYSIIAFVIIASLGLSKINGTAFNVIVWIMLIIEVLLLTVYVALGFFKDTEIEVAEYKEEKFEEARIGAKNKNTSNRKEE